MVAIYHQGTKERLLITIVIVTLESNQDQQQKSVIFEPIKRTNKKNSK